MGSTKRNDIAPKMDKKKPMNPGKMAWRLQPGSTWNPLLGLPRNITCPCKSGKKFKKCCMEKLPRAISKQEAVHIKNTLAKGPITFDWDTKKVKNINT